MRTSRRHLPLAAALLAICSGACAPGCDGPRTVASEIPGWGAMRILDCSEVEAWIGAVRSQERFLAEQPNALLVRVARDGTVTSRELPGARVSTFQSGAGGGVAVPFDGRDAGVVGLRLSVGGDEREEPIAMPPWTFGAAFHSPSDGYAWSAGTIHRTRDGGRTWERRSIEPGEILRGPSTVPQLSGSGDLWVPIQGSEVGTLLVWKQDGASRTVARWKGERIRSVRVTQEGSVHVVLAPEGAPGFRVLALPIAGGEAREVYRHPTGSMAEFTASGSRLALRVVDGGPPSSFFGAWPRYLHTSVDGGRSWRVRSVTSARIDSICATASGIWASSTGERNVGFVRW